MKEGSLLNHVENVEVVERTSKNGNKYYVLVVKFDNGFTQDSLIRYGSEFAYKQLLD